MRVTREVAEENRKKVVETAGRLFREYGFDGIGVAALMQAAGLTHGGFYKQFADKAALASEATEAALAENHGKWLEVIAASDAPPGKAVAAWYLSPPHIGNRAEGCCFAALASEAPRHGAPVRAAFTEAIGESVALLAGPEGETEDAMRQLCLMVGALVLARATDSEDLSHRLLAAARADG
jgi:TetR/AcrR family transcriptional repressor of nem operon